MAGRRRRQVGFTGDVREVAAAVVVVERVMGVVGLRQDERMGVVPHRLGDLQVLHGDDPLEGEEAQRVGQKRQAVAGGGRGHGGGRDPVCQPRKACGRRPPAAQVAGEAAGGGQEHEQGKGVELWHVAGVADVDRRLQDDGEEDAGQQVSQLADSREWQQHEREHERRPEEGSEPADAAADVELRGEPAAVGPLPIQRQRERF